MWTITAAAKKRRWADDQPPASAMGAGKIYVRLCASVSTGAFFVFRAPKTQAQGQHFPADTSMP